MHPVKASVENPFKSWNMMSLYTLFSVKEFLEGKSKG